MRILITEWALASYTELLNESFSKDDYWNILRPDILKLRHYPTDDFKDSHFWGPAQSNANSNVLDGWKMKWHNIGPGRIQLRLGVAIIKHDVFICHGWSKTRPQDYREGLMLENRIEHIKEGNYILRGELS